MAEPYLLCGTATGDILGVNIDTTLLQFHGPGSNKGPHSKVSNFNMGVTAMVRVNIDKKNKDSDKKSNPGCGNLIVGSGDGEVAIVSYTCITDKDKKTRWVFEKKKYVIFKFYNNSLI